METESASELWYILLSNNGQCTKKIVQTDITVFVYYSHVCLTEHKSKWKNLISPAALEDI